MSTQKQIVTSKNVAPLGKQRSYSEIVEFLNNHWTITHDKKNMEVMKKLDEAFDCPSKKLRTILIGGTNGKSLTAHFTAKLLKKEGLSVGTLYAPHILTYNERFSLDGESISNKIFTEFANEVITVVEAQNIQANSQEMLIQIALNYFVKNNVDVAIFEVENGGISDPISICNPKIVAITRLTGMDANSEGQASENALKEYLGIVTKGSHLISADQNKANLKHMDLYAQQVGALWAMPIRKLVALPYPFEQIHGRCAALAERISAIFINSFALDSEALAQDSLLAKKKGQRGRPTLEAKRESELNPKKTIEHFWKDTVSTLTARFQILEKEKPTIILDNAHNIDALNNFLLGIRLLHYRRAIKGLTLIVACPQETLDNQEFLRSIRYFFKKTSGNIIVCPTPERPDISTTSWNAEEVAQDMKNLKIKARSARNFKEAFEAAKKSLNDRNGLIAIAGPDHFIAEYWNYKDIKKL